MNESNERIRDEGMEGRIARLEERIARLEGHLNLAGDSGAQVAGPPTAVARVGNEPASGARTEDEFEFEVGQNWFAKVGILALATGVAFTLSLPHASLPPAVPSLFGYGAAIGMFLVAHRWRKSFELVSAYLRGVGMALLYFATLRLYFFGERPVLSTASPAGILPLVLVVGINLAIAFRRQSPYLVSLALATGCATAVAVDASWFVLVTITAVAAIAVHFRLRYHWPALVFVGMGLGYLTYLVWAIHNPFLGREYHLVREPAPCLGFILICAAIFAAGSFLRRDRELEDAFVVAGTLLNCGIGYGLFLVHSLVFGSILVPAHVAAALVFLGVAAVFWVRERSRISTFFYAMTGYLALTVAIIKASPVPSVFVWLSLQSVVVVTTAIWFRSRFIVVANFLIYLGIVGAYVVTTRHETGISLGFGLVALLTARILNWRKERLELRTEIMRNAYLLCAFAIFPYALYHLVPATYLGLSWVGVALTYYAINLVVRNQKYRWMGHGTLMLTALYLVIVGISQFDPLYRIVSFFVLGMVLLVVSLLFTRTKSRQNAKQEPAAGE